MPTRAILIIFAILITCGSCGTDKPTQAPITAPEPNAAPEVPVTTADIEEGIEKETTKPLLEEPTMDVLSSTPRSSVPRMEDWVQIYSESLPGMDLHGIAAASPTILLLSDLAQNKVVSYETTNKKIVEVISDVKVEYLQQRYGRLIIPIINKNSVQVYRGEPALMTFPIPYELNEPCSFDGFRIDDYVIVDRGNNRLVLNKGGVFELVGEQGSGAEQFDNPQVVTYIGDEIFVSDQGNNRIQKLSQAAKFVTSFGTDHLESPSGMTTDGKFLFVLDSAKNAVLLFSAEGDFLYALSDDFDNPRDIYFSQGRLYISEAGGRFRIYKNKKYPD